MSYDDAFAAAPHIELITRACPRFVEFVENGVTSGAELIEVAREYLEPVIAADIDTLVLGCTHYPLLTGVISYVMGQRVTLISSADETAKDVYRQLVELNLMRAETAPAPTIEFLTTGSLDQFREIGRRFLGPVLTTVERAADRFPLRVPTA
jgi:glutamate racemase